MSERLQFKVTETGLRLDVFLARSSAGISRSRIQKLIADKQVWVNGNHVRANTLLELDDCVELVVPPPQSTELKAENIPIKILYEDTHLLVLDKDAGMVVHPGAGNWEGTLVQALMHHCGDKLPVINGEQRPGIVHRIDKNTSGVLVVAKDDASMTGLAAQFKTHSIDRRYQGIALGKLAEEGSFTEAIGRDTKERKRMWVNENGKAAKTLFKRTGLYDLGAGFELSAFEAKLLTGRTHQIRVHFAFHGLPLLGDTTYSTSTRRNRKDEFLLRMRKHHPSLYSLVETLYEHKRQFLHASLLAFTHPISGESLRFESPLPADLRAILEQLC